MSKHANYFNATGNNEPSNWQMLHDVAFVNAKALGEEVLIKKRHFTTVKTGDYTLVGWVKVPGDFDGHQVIYFRESELVREIKKHIGKSNRVKIDSYARPSVAAAFKSQSNPSIERVLNRMDQKRGY